MADKEVKITLTIDGIDQEVKDVNDLKEKMKDLGKETKKAGEETTIFGDLKDKFKDATGGIRKVIGSFKTLKGAIAATGIGALLIAITSLVAYFKSTEEGSRKLAIATEALSLIFGKLTEFAGKVGEGLVNVFTNPKEALENFGRILKQQIVNRITGMLELLPALGKAIGLAFKGKFKEAAKTAANAAGKVVLGVENVVEKAQEVGTKAVEAFQSLKKEINEAVEIATALVDAQRAIRDQQQKLTVENAELNQELEKQRKIAEDTTLAYDERKAALERVGEIQVQLAKNVADQAKAEEDLLKQQIANANSYEEREELETQLAEATAARIDAQTALNTVEQEAAKLGRELDLEELDRKTAINDMLKAMELENIEDAFVRAQEELNAQEAAAMAELDRLRATEEEKQAIADEFTEKRKKLKKEEADYEKALQQAVIDNDLSLAAGALNAISRLVGENTAFGKAAAIATTTIDTYMAAQKAYASQLTLDPTSPIRAAIAAGVAVANGLANVRAIVATKTPGTASVPAGGTPGRPNIQQFNPANALGAQEAGETIGIDTTAGVGAARTAQPIKAYVVASEMTSQQEADKKIDDLARL